MSAVERKSAPIVTIAAIAVIIFSGVGVGVLTGVIPSSFSNSGQPDLTANPPAQTKPGGAVADRKASSQPTAPHAKERVAQNEMAGRTGTHVAAANVCSTCGVVQSINVAQQKGEGSGIGLVAGGVAGAVLGNQVGQGTGKDIATIAGAAGGAYAGNEIEKNLKKTARYDIVVRLDDGTTRTVTQQTQPDLRVGDKVKIVDGAVVKI